MAANVPEPGDGGGAPTGVIISAALAIVLALLIGFGALAGRPTQSLSAELTAIAVRGAEQAAARATAETAGRGVGVGPGGQAEPPSKTGGTPSPLQQVPGTPRAATAASTPGAPPAEPGAGNANNGRQLFTSQGCSGCHTIPGVSTGAVGPPLGSIGIVAATRKPGYSAGQYIVESLHTPNAFVVPGFAPNLMPSFATLSPTQINDVVAFLLQQRR